MELYDGGRAPNPRRTRIFIAEKGIDVPLRPVDMSNGEHGSEEFRQLNPFQRLPILTLDDGRVLTESIAICRYLEALYPEPALFGTNPIEIAMIEMWNRRLELGLYQFVSTAFRHTHPAMAQSERPQVREWGEANREKASDFLHLFDDHLAQNTYAAGEAFSVADITGLVAVDFMKPARIEMPEGLAHVRRWHEAVSARPSAKA